MSCQLHRPSSVAEAVRLRGDLGPSASFLAGGTDLNSRPAAPAHLISLAALGLDGIVDRGREVEIGACTTLQRLIEDPAVPAPLRTAALHVGNRNVRNAATIGGHIGANAPAADLLPALVVLGARIVLASVEGEREIPVLDAIAGLTGLVTRVVVPVVGSRRVATLHHVRTANDRSIVCAAVALRRDEDRVLDPVVAVGGVAAHTVRLERVERWLDDRELQAADRIEAFVRESVSPPADVRGSAELKAHLAGVLVARAVAAAWEGR
jgi:carbon-monoxide dehydrogenase medium subunit